MDDTHKRLLKEQAWYKAWHSVQHISAIHFMLLAGATAWMGQFVLRQVAQDIPLQAAAITSQANSSVGQLTSQMLKLSKDYIAAETPEEEAAILSQLTAVVSERKAALVELMEQNPKQFLLATIPPGLARRLPDSIQPLLEDDVDLSGELTVIHRDYEKEKHAEFQYQVKDEASGKVYTVHFADGVTGATTGARVKVHGVALAQDVAVAYAGGTTFQTQAAGAAAAIGVQKTIVIPVNFTDKSNQPYSQTQIAGIFFTDANSLNMHYQNDSFGQTSFSGDVTPWFTVPYAASTVCSNDYAVRSAADQAATNAGYVLSNYTRKVYVVPDAGCGWGGFSTVGGSPSYSVVNAYNQPYFVQVVEHELGHALGQNHASTRACGSKAIDVYSNCSFSEYGDNFDPLGYYSSNDSNSAHKFFFGWFAAANVLKLGANASGTYTIAPIEGKSSSVQLIQIPKANTNEYYYIGYRQPIGNDTNLSSTLTNGASIHVAGAGSGNTAWLDLTPGDSNYTNAALTDGATFTDSINGLSITQVSHTAAGVTVTIASSQPACTPAAPTLSITPSSQTAGAGASASYTVSVVNKDSSTCPSSTFSLTSAAPAGWPATFSPASISLTPGASGSASYTVQVPANTADGVYTTSPQVADAQVSAHSTSGAASLTVFTDTVGPLISITSPSSGAKLKGNGSTNVAASASDSSGISAMVISMDGSVLKNCGAVSSCSYSLSNKSVSTGSHTITVSATDKLTNTTTKSITVTK